MKNLYKWMMFSWLAFGVVSCDFDTENYQEISIDQAYQSVQDVQNGMNGAYNALGDYYFLGNYAIAYGDFCAGISEGSASTGHFYYQSNWVISDTDQELEDMWLYGFKVIDAATRTVIGGKKVLADADKLFLDNSDIANVNLYIAQCYALKALSNYYLVNLFALPYQQGAGNLGLPLVKDEPVAEFTKIDRATVGETYEQITGDIEQAEIYMDRALTATDESGKALLSTPSAFFMGPMAIQALKARVNMMLGNYGVAKTAAENAIALKGKGDGTGNDGTPSNDIYLSMWTSLAVSDEDLFTISKSEADNLSANSLNTLYGSYGCTLSENARKTYGPNDIRAKLIGDNTTLKFQGLPTSAATSNIPVFRKSEMSLILAEVYARASDVPKAQKYLMYTAKRNEDLDMSDLPSTKDGLLEFISEERIREFAGEGHRFYDARRMGEKIEGIGTVPFDIQKFVFPIPAAEINAGYCTQQNDGWADNLPQ